MKNPDGKSRIYAVCECAVLVAIAAVLSFIKLPISVFGGSLDIVMVPLFIICSRRGAGYGILSGACFGLIKCLIGGGIGWGLPSVLLDYVLAYAAVGTAGFLYKKPKLSEVAILLGCASRYAVHFISGVTIYKILVPTAVEGTPWVFANPVAYSLVYNAIYMLPNTVLAICIMSVLRIPLKRLK